MLSSLTNKNKRPLSIKCPQWFKFFSLFETQIHTLRNIKIPNKNFRPKVKFVLTGFQIYNTFFLHRLDSKESARDNHKARQTDARYTIPSMKLHYKSRSFSRFNDSRTLVSLIYININLLTLFVISEPSCTFFIYK